MYVGAVLDVARGRGVDEVEDLFYVMCLCVLCVANPYFVKLIISTIVAILRMCIIVSVILCSLYVVVLFSIVCYACVSVSIYIYIYYIHE